MIQTQGLTRRFGRKTAVQGLDLLVPQGSVTGLVGPNGAGKTTTLAMLSTLLAPTSGEAFVCGFAIPGQTAEVRRRIGYLPDRFAAYEDATVESYLAFFAAAYRIEGERGRRVVGDVLELTDLGPVRAEPVAALSLGMRQRLGLARVLVHDPEVLLLDEPAGGLDPAARIQLRAILEELRRMGKTVLVSSHVLLELAEVCDRLALLVSGRLVFSGTLAEALARAGGGPALRVRVEGEPSAAAALLERDPWVRAVSVQGAELRVELSDGAGTARVARTLVQAGLGLVRLVDDAPDLEQAFLRLTAGVEGAGGEG
ncbi:MAG: ABC transporter ATP-binding protein [Planctomycetes bacterium]|nr:ABC transporter ATP-binding protein [Planctomycetota bacterium]